MEIASNELGKSRQNGSNESCNGTFRKECLNAEVNAGRTEAQVTSKSGSVVTTNHGRKVLGTASRRRWHIMECVKTESLRGQVAQERGNLSELIQLALNQVTLMRNCLSISGKYE